MRIIKIRLLYAIKFFFLGMCIVLIMGCSNEKDNKDKMSTINTDVLNPILEHEILKFVNSVDSIKGSRHLQNVLLVYFYKEDSICQVEMRTNYFYEKEDFDGYLIFNGYMIAFYGAYKKCSSELINPRLLNNEVNADYKSEDECVFRPYEAQVKKYKVLNNSLVEYYNGTD